MRDSRLKGITPFVINKWQGPEPFPDVARSVPVGRIDNSFSLPGCLVLAIGVFISLFVYSALDQVLVALVASVALLVLTVIGFFLSKRWQWLLFLRAQIKRDIKRLGERRDCAEYVGIAYVDGAWKYRAGLSWDRGYLFFEGEFLIFQGLMSQFRLPRAAIKHVEIRPIDSLLEWAPPRAYVTWQMLDEPRIFSIEARAATKLKTATDEIFRISNLIRAQSKGADPRIQSFQHPQSFIFNSPGGARIMPKDQFRATIAATGVAVLGVGLSLLAVLVVPKFPSVFISYPTLLAVILVYQRAMSKSAGQSIVPIDTAPPVEVAQSLAADGDVWLSIPTLKRIIVASYGWSNQMVAAASVYDQCCHFGVWVRDDGEDLCEECFLALPGQTVDLAIVWDCEGKVRLFINQVPAFQIDFIRNVITGRQSLISPISMTSEYNDPPDLLLDHHFLRPERLFAVSVYGNSLFVPLSNGKVADLLATTWCGVASDEIEARYRALTEVSLNLQRKIGSEDSLLHHFESGPIIEIEPNDPIPSQGLKLGTTSTNKFVNWLPEWTNKGKSVRILKLNTQDLKKEVAERKGFEPPEV